MASTASTRVRAELIGEFEKTNAWATSLNAAIERLDDGIGQFTTIALVGNYTLTSANFIADEARAAMLRFTGTGAFEVTAPAVSKLYCIINDCTGDLTIKPSGGTGSVVRAGTRMVVAIDGSTARTFDTTLDRIAAPVAAVSLNSQKITNLATPTVSTDGATKAYVDTANSDRSMGGFKITNVAAGTASTDAINKAQLDAGIFTIAGGAPAGTAAGQVLVWNGSSYAPGQVDLADADARTGALPVANGGTGLATLTAGSVLVGNGTSAPTLVAPSTAGRILTSNGAGVAPSFQDLNAPGSLIFISTQTLTSVATCNFTSGFSSTYDEFEFHINNLIPASGASFWIRTSTNAGSSYDAGASDYQSIEGYHNTGSATPAGSGFSNAAQIAIGAGGNVGSGANENGISLIVRVIRPTVAKFAQIEWRGHYVAGGGALFSTWGSGQRLTAADVDAIRFMFSTGNIASGVITMYGIKKS